MSTSELITNLAASGRMSRAGIACCVIAYLLAGFFAARNVSSWHTRIVYPGEESYEGAALGEIARFGQGVEIYLPPSAEGFSGGMGLPTFRCACFPPFRYWAARLAARCWPFGLRAVKLLHGSVRWFFCRMAW